jgi:excisionase family DNA binding protein
METMFYDVEEAAKMLHYTTTTVRTKIRAGDIPANQVGRKYLSRPSISKGFGPLRSFPNHARRSRIESIRG